MKSLQPINRKARSAEQAHLAAEADVEALQEKKKKERNKHGQVYYPLGCTLNFGPGWEVDVSGGTAGLCQPVERDLYGCYVGCSWPAQVPDHVTNNPDWSSKCSAAVSDWRDVDVIYP